MRRHWTIRGLVTMLVAQLVTVTVGSSVALAAGGPSTPLPDVGSVAVRQETRQPRGEDQATKRSLQRDQLPVTPSAGSGNSSATSLKPSATWDVSLNTGDFAWSYPLRVPPAPGGLAPTLALSYRSSAVDGMTSETNNQPSWIGDGWDMWPGYIERTYGACVEDDSKTGDLCWRSDNATAAYSGGGGMLIHEGDQWRAKNDDGTRIERFTGKDNGDNDGEHWRITTVDGTQYWFGSQTDAKSTWTVPVYGDDAQEPCNVAGSFEASHCVQAWRWNLDKIVDRNGNVIRYFYTTETNSYGMNAKDDAVSYIRGGSLDHIDYGLHETVPGPATGRVDFALADRCVRDSECVVDKRGNWPDTPLKLSCTATPCKEHGPSFWTTKRLASVTTNVWRGSSYEPVDRWTLDQQFPGTGDIGAEQRESAALWLKGITHTGLLRGTAELPSVTFEGTLFPNRVDGDKDGYAPLNRYRITGIVSESGGVTAIGYEAPDCKTGQTMPANPETNTMRCFPVLWAPEGHEPRTDYFHKYVVSSVIQSDMLASSAAQVTRYEYLDGAAWHWNMSEFTKDDKKTWNEFRGFGRVRVRTGSQDDPGGSPRSMSEQRFYRGMNQDRLPNNGKRSVQVTDSLGQADSARDDHDWLAGVDLEATTYANEAPSTAPAPPAVTRTVKRPMWKGPTASRGDYHAYIVRPEVERGFTALKSGGFRETRTVTRYDDDAARGLPTSLNDFGDVSTPDDDQCARNTYAPDTATWLLDLPSRVETVSVNCDTTPAFPRDAVSDVKMSYDSKGNPEKVEVAKERPAAGPVYLTTKTAKYDKHGRSVETTDALGHIAKTGYTPAEGGPVTEVAITGPTGLVSKTLVEPALGAPLKVIDPNNRVTETSYDPLGRRAQVWLPNRPRGSNPEGSAQYAYQVARDKPVVVTTSGVGPNGVFVSSNAIYDGLLRPRQTQQPGVGIRREPGKPEVPMDEGRLITDTRYDSQGRVYKTTQPYYNSGAVDANLWLAADAEVPGLTRTKYDGAGRAVESVYQSGAFDRWKRLTTYDGDRTSITPPAGGTPTTTISNAFGQITELRQYRGTKPEGEFDATRYKYSKAGDLTEVTAPDGATWKYEYDLRGREILANDPDSGTRTTTYDDAGRPTSAKDALGRVLAYGYDALDRRTGIYEDSPQGKKLAEWTYDTANSGKGLLATSTRFVDGNPYTTTIDTYTALNKPLYTFVTIPASEGALAGKYELDFGYGKDGSLTSETYPKVQAASVGDQTVTYNLDDWARPTSTTTGAGALLVAGTTYTRYGEVQRIEQGATGARAWQSFYYDTNTRRQTRTVVDAEVPKPMQSDVRYTYDDAGNITSAADLTMDAPADVQCFRYDSLRRLTEAWTGSPNDWQEGNGERNGGCTAEPAVADGAAPYWNSYRHTPGGNRVEETQRSRTSTVKRTYAYPNADQPQPHTVRSVSSPAGTETYEYNPIGETTRRVKSGTDQTLSWDREGRVSSVVSNGKTTSFLYTANGTRLIRKDPSATTLYLGKQEIRLPAGAESPPSRGTTPTVRPRSPCRTAASCCIWRRTTRARPRSRSTPRT
jgi:YD repeat-containing protein